MADDTDQDELAEKLLRVHLGHHYDLPSTARTLGVPLAHAAALKRRGLDGVRAAFFDSISYTQAECIYTIDCKLRDIPKGSRETKGLVELRCKVLGAFDAKEVKEIRDQLLRFVPLVAGGDDA
jgi:hypothetical protein